MEAKTFEQLKAGAAALMKAAADNLQDKQKDKARAEQQLKSLQSFVAGVQKTWPENVAAPYQARMEKHAAAVARAATEASNAAELVAVMKAATAKVVQLAEAEEAARKAGWKGGIQQAGPVLTGSGR